MKSELCPEVNQNQNYLNSDDLRTIRRQLGYSSTNIYTNTLKYRHHNYVTRNKNEQYIK